MNLQVLEETLRRLSLPKALVSLGRAVDSTWCLVPTGGGRWEVYWSSRESQYSHVVLDDESTACYYLLGKLVHDQVLARDFKLPD